MAKQISVSDEVYSILIKRKKNKSFSEVIKDMAKKKEGRKDPMKFFGAFANNKDFKKLEKVIEEEREQNYGREYK